MTDEQRAFIEWSCKQNNQPIPEHLSPSKPKYQGMLNAFYFLSQRRIGDYGCITDGQLFEYVAYRGSCGLHPDDMIRVINVIDNHYLKIKSDKAREDMENMKHRKH